MTVEFVRARPYKRSVPRKRLSLPGVLLVSSMVTCAFSACSDRADDARAVLTTSAARELAQTQPATSSPPQQDAFSAPSTSPDSADGSAALTAQAIRSPARAAAPPDAASGADSLNSGAGIATSDAPLAPPEIHSAD